MNKQLGELPIAPVMRELNTAVLEGEPFIPDTEYAATGEENELLNAIRPELYAITGVLLPFAVGHFVSLHEANPPFGIAGGEKPPQTFNELRMLLMADSEKAAGKFTVPSKYGPVADRYNVLVARYHEIDGRDISKSSRIFMQAGLNTAIDMSVGASSGIRNLAETERKQTTREDFLGISGRSSRLVTKIAAKNIGQTDPLRRVLKAGNENDGKWTSPYFNPNVLSFYPDPEDPEAYVDYVKPLDNFVDPRAASRIGQLSLGLETIGCPALYSPVRGVESSVRLMWDHISGMVAVMKYPE